MNSLKRALALSFALTALASVALANPASKPANPKATAETRAVLRCFQGLSGTPARRIISGQFDNFGLGANMRLMTEISEKTGHWPAIIGVDYADFSRRDFETKQPNKTAIAYWNQGGWVTVSAHLYNPVSSNRNALRSRSVDLASLLAPGSEAHQHWMQELDQLAAGLKELDDAGVVVLWRPFHEMNGGWFWWGGKDPETFIKLWRQMFDYFTRTKGLNNLIWVYAPNTGENTASYYAGDRYVDLVGLDAYTDFVDQKHIPGYAEVAALPKPFGFTEYGPHGSRNPPGDFDYLRFLAGVRSDFPKTCFFMPWNAKWSLATNINTRQLLDNPLIINRADLPAHNRPEHSVPVKGAQLLLHRDSFATDQHR
jgi:mannan endo-1,4-beta-mannosidase